MKKEFRYKPPIKYMIIGILSLPVSFLFYWMIDKDKFAISIFVGIFGTILLAIGTGFLVIFINKYGVGKLVITDSYIIIPGRWKGRRTVNFDEIIELSEFNAYDEVIELVTNNEVYLIEKQWMKAKNFETVKNHLAKLNG